MHRALVGKLNNLYQSTYTLYTAPEDLLSCLSKSFPNHAFGKLPSTATNRGIDMYLPGFLATFRWPACSRSTAFWFWQTWLLGSTSLGGTLPIWSLLNSSAGTAVLPMHHPKIPSPPLMALECLCCMIRLQKWSSAQETIACWARITLCTCLVWR